MVTKNFQAFNELLTWLDEKKIVTSSWGRGDTKRVDDLWRELCSGEIKLQDDPPLRLVNVVEIITYQDRQYLIEAIQEFGNGKQRRRNQPPSEKIKAGENYLEAAVRCLYEELNLPAENIFFLPNLYRSKQQVRDSLSYPGLQTRYTIHTVSVNVTGLPQEDFWCDNLSYGYNDPIKRHFWQWEANASSYAQTDD